MSQQMKTSVLTLALLCITFCLPQSGQAQDARIAVVDTQALTTTDNSTALFWKLTEIGKKRMLELRTVRRPTVQS